MTSCYSMTAGMAAVMMLATPSMGATLTALSSFGGGDGWRAPNEIVAGDTAGTATGLNYNYLQSGSLERGFAYNPATGNLILVSRSTAGNGIRVLDGVTGADVGFLNQGSGVIGGGTFTTNMPVASADGSIYVGNLTTNASAAGSAFKVYQWTNEGAAAPTVYFNSAIAGFTGTPRLGDSLDLTGSGAGTTLAAGASGVIGYAIINGSGGTAVPSFAGAGPSLNAGDFRLGVTFAGTANDVWGKQTGAGNNLELTSYVAGVGTSLGNVALTSLGEAPMDYAVVGGIPVLATIDINNSLVRVYDVTVPTTPVLLASATTTTGTLAGNVNGVGSVQFGPITGTTAVLYAMSSNQGIQAMTLNVIPEPTSLSMIGMSLAAIFAASRARSSSNV